MSYVYRAQDIETGAAVAVKILLPRLSRDPAAVERLRREATIAMRLDHPNVCPILRMGEADRMIYLVMPYLEGEPLSEHEARRGPLSVGRGDPPAGPDVPGPAARARAADHPPRSQARERDAGARPHHRRRRAALPGRGHGFRPGQGAAGRSRGRQADRHRHRARHAGVHEPRADPRQAARRPERRLRARHPGVRAVHAASCRSPASRRRRP